MLARLMTIVKAAEMMPVERVKELGDLGKAFVREFVSEFPDENISLKMHVLEVHLPEMGERYGTTGLFSEDAIESIHAVLMGHERRCAGMGNKVGKEAAIVQGFMAQTDSA